MTVLDFLAVVCRVEHGQISCQSCGNHFPNPSPSPDITEAETSRIECPECEFTVRITSLNTYPAKREFTITP